MPTPPSSGLQLWLKADSLALADGAGVNSWPDSSGNNNTANYAFGTQPTYHINQINGLPAVTVPNTQINFTTAIGPQTAVTAFAVIKLVNTSSKGFLIGGTLNGFAYWTGNGGKLQGCEAQNQTSCGNGTAAADTSWHQINCKQQNVSLSWILEFRVDGAADPALNINTTSMSGNINNVGNDGYSSGNTFNGQVAEILIYNRALLASEITTVESYLFTRYSIGVPPPPTQRGNIAYDQIKTSSRQGPGSKLQTFGGGSVTTGHLAVFDANGSVIDGGAVPSGGGGSYTLPPATASVLGGVKIGSNITVAGDGTISVAAPGAGSVTSVGLSMPAEFTVAGSPVTSSGTLAVTKASQSANLVYAGPTTGSATPAFRALAAADLPSTVAYTNVSNNFTTDQTITGQLHATTYVQADLGLFAVSPGYLQLTAAPGVYRLTPTTSLLSFDVSANSGASYATGCAQLSTAGALTLNVSPLTLTTISSSGTVFSIGNTSTSGRTWTLTVNGSSSASPGWLVLTDTSVPQYALGFLTGTTLNRVAVFKYPQGAVLGWCADNVGVGSAIDVGIQRNAAGVLQVSDTNGADRDLKCRALTTSGVLTVNNAGGATINGPITAANSLNTISFQLGGTTAASPTYIRASSGSTITLDQNATSFGQTATFGNALTVSAGLAALNGNCDVRVQLRTVKDPYYWMVSYDASSNVHVGTNSPNGYITYDSPLYLTYANFTQPANVVIGTGWGTWTPSLSATGMTIALATLYYAQYIRFGPIIFFSLSIAFNLTGTASAGPVTFSLPISCPSGSDFWEVHPPEISLAAGGALYQLARGLIPSGTSNLNVYLPGNAAFTIGNNIVVRCSGMYRCA
jgi:hypothetical protein